MATVDHSAGMVHDVPQTEHEPAKSNKKGAPEILGPTIVEPIMVAPESADKPSEDDTAKPEKPEPVPREPAKYYLHASQVLQGLAVCWVLCLLMFIRWLKPGLFTTLGWALMSFPAGLALTWLYHQNRTRKEEALRKHNMNVGIKGLTQLCGSVPSWVSFEDSDSVEWLNTMLTQMWPYYDPAICAAIKASVEPIMEQFTPPFIKRIGFKKLTFGDAPFRIERVQVKTETREEVVMEMDLRWRGQASIILAIEQHMGGSATRMAPRIADLTVRGRLRLSFKPLVDTVPGFGAILVALIKPPLIKFNINLGAALGGDTANKPILSFVDGLIREQLVNMLVWPNRIVVPLMGEEVTGPLDFLYLRTVGVLWVQIMHCSGLKSGDKDKKTDVRVTAHIQPSHKVETPTAKTKNPTWEKGNVFWLPVQEPSTESLRYEVDDMDGFSVSELVHLNLKKATGGSSFLGRGAVPLGAVCEHPAHMIRDSFPLGRGEYTDDHGTGKGYGEIQLSMYYLPLSRMEPRASSLGALHVWIRSAKDLTPAGEADSVNAYVRVKVGGGSSKRKPGVTHVVRGTCDPNWGRVEFVFYDVELAEGISLEVLDKGSYSDDSLGKVVDEVDPNDPQQGSLEIAGDVAESSVVDTHSGDIMKGVMEKDFLLDGEEGGHYPTLRAKLQFIPMDFVPPQSTQVMKYPAAAGP